MLSVQNVEELDNPYKWAEGIVLRTDDPYTELADIVKYGSKEAYEASLPEAHDEFNSDMDYRMSKMELGLSRGGNDMTYGYCKKIIASGKYDKNEMKDKLDVFLLANRITDEQYKELMQMMEG